MGTRRREVSAPEREFASSATATAHKAATQAPTVGLAVTVQYCAILMDFF